MKKLSGIVLALVVLASVSFGASGLYPLPVETMAKWGATHEFVVTHADLTTTTSNTAQTLTFNVSARQSVQLVALILDEPFKDASGALTTNSLVLTVGDGTDADLFLAATELASDGTEVYVQFSPPGAGTIAITAQTLALTGTVQNVAVMTNATAAFTGTLIGSKVYTASDTIDHLFTPDAITPVSRYTTGKLRLFYRILP